MIDHDAGTFSGKYISGVSTEGRRVGVVVPLEGSGAERILRTGRPFLRQDIRIDESLSGDSARLQVGLRSSLGVPLFTKSRITGILTVHSHRVEAFGPRDQAILERLADQVAPAVESAQLYESLRQSETTNRAFVRAIPDNMFRLRRDGMYLDCIAPKPEDLYDPSGDYVGRTIYEILPAELAQMIMASIERALQTGEIQKYEYQSTRRAKVQERELRIVADGPDDVLIISRDITERKRMEDALRDSEERFRRLFEESPVGVTLVDEEFRVIGANNAFCRMLGYTEEDLVGGTIADVTHLEEVVASEELLKKTLSGETPGFQLETRLITKERGIIWARVTGGPVHDDAGKPQYVIGVIENVSERKLLQEQLGQAQKMEVVGQLAGGVAHDFNNLLTPILGFSDLGMEELTPDHPARRYFEQVQSAAERGADLVRRLMLFVRQACHASRR
jgi:PAS domain S-box-containing protein